MEIKIRGRDCPTKRAKFINTKFMQQMKQEHVYEIMNELELIFELDPLI